MISKGRKSPEEELPSNLKPSNDHVEGDERADYSGTNEGILTIKTANDWIEEAAKRPNPRTFFHGLIVEFENTVLFASTGIGKSILAVQIGEDIAKTETVCYIDLELSDKQFQVRYTDKETGEVHFFPENFFRAEIDPELIGAVDVEQEILDSIEKVANNGIRFIIIDNITFLCRDAEKSKDASEFMMKIIKLKKIYGLTTIVIAHTPKRSGYEPITTNDLAGSSKLISFFDAGIAMASSAREIPLRYLKQVKVRTGDKYYDCDNVMVLDPVKSDGYLHFEIQGYAKEEQHLKQGKDTDDNGEIFDILHLKKKGMSLREIAKQLGFSLGKVQRRLNKAEKENITLPPDNPEDGSPEPDVSTVSDDDKPIQPLQPIHAAEELPLCYEED